MEKHKSEKKKGLKWILLAAGILVLAAAVGLGLWFLLGDQGEAEAEEGHVKLYWNVERDSYVAGNEDGTSSRFPRGDGYYYVRFAVDGEQVDYPVASYDLVNRIDHVDVCNLIFDENGVVVDMRTVNDCTGGLVAPALYVSSVEGNKITGNTQGTYLGVDITIEIDEETEVYSVGGEGILVGVPCQVQNDDEIIAIKDPDGTIGHVFVIAYEPPGDVYWNIYRKYSSTTKSTTRESDALGYYTYEFALNGELVTLRTRDQKVANSIDSRAAKCMGLVLDENGEIDSAVATSAVDCPSTFGSWYHVTGFTDTTVTVERIAAGTDQGTVTTGVLAPNCKIIDVSAQGGYSGAYTELRVGDQIHGLKDSRGRVAYIFVHTRLSGEDMPLYWNVSRKYNSTTKSTTRTPDAEGWYYAEVTTGGKEPITVKTKDKDLMSSLDSYAARCFTMSLKGDNEIDRISSAAAAHGGATFGSWYYVDSIEGDQITVSRILSGDTEPTVVTGTMSKDIEIINGTTNYENYCGEYTELQVGDRVHGLTNLQKEVRVLFVVERPVDVPIYWNLTRGYNSTTKETTKTPDADGFYWFTFAVNGEQQTLKTRSKEIANKIDSNAARCWGLRVWNGEITEVISVSSVKGYSGGTKSISWVDVVRINGQNVLCQKNQAGHAQDGNTFNTYIGNACEIYDVSNGYTEYAGEPTTLREGDQIHALHNGEGIAMIIWVVGGRSKPLDTKPNDCPCAESVTWEPWDGTTELESGKYYYLTNDVTAPTEGFYIENKTVYLRLDGHTIESDGRVFWTGSGAKLNICDHDTRGKLVGTGIANESGGVIRMYTASGDAEINLWNIDVVVKSDSSPAKEGGAISCAGPMTLHNVNVIDGVASAKGGNVTVSKYGTFRMFGGSLEDGNAKGGAGGNLNVEGVVYLEDITVTNGKASGAGDNIYVTNAGYEKRINGLTSTGGDVALTAGSVAVLGTIKADLTMSAGTTLENMGVDDSSKITLTKDSEGTIMTGADTDMTGLFTNTDTTGDFVITYNASAKEVYMDCTIVPVDHEADHCVCLGNDLGLADHTCKTLTGWTEITDDVFETAIGTNNSAQGVKFIEDGNYYLSVNYTLPDDLCIMPDQNITICLNGCQLRSPGRAGMIAGNLTITDCVGSGQVYTTGNNANGNTFKVLAGGQLDVYGGTLTAKTSCTDGGVVAVTQDKGSLAPSASTEPGVFNLYGGTVTGGSATNGGNIIIWHTSVFNMYGGTVSSGTSNSGANLKVSNGNATANLLGGTIEDGDVLIYAGTVNVGGSVKIEELNGNGKTVTVSDKGLNSDASITMVAGVAGTLVSNVSDSAYGCFSFTDIGENLTVEYDAAQDIIVAEFSYTHYHCVCGGVKPAGHTCSTEGWMPLNAETVGNYFSVSSSRYVANSDELYLYLTEDLDLSYSINLNAGQTIHLCLNGFDLTHTKTSNPVMRVWGDLDVTDCSSGRSGSIIGHRTGESPCLYVQNWVGGTTWCSPTVNMFAGTLTADDGNTSAKAGVMQIGNKNSPDRDQIAVFNMYGGKICGGDANNGGNVLIGCGDAIFNMYGGTVTDGNATGNGGGIYASYEGSQVNLLGGTVTGNAAKLGDDLYTTSSCDVTLGGTVTVGEYYSNTIVLTLKNLNAASSIKILRNDDASALFATGADTDVSKCFTNPTMTAVWDEAAKTLSFVAGGTTEPEPEPEAHAAHCLCADANGMPASHTCTNVQWTALTQTDFDNANESSSPVYTWLDGSSTRYGLVDGGYYYLSENITITNNIALAEGASASICLNGKTLTASGTRAIFTKGTLSITDCGYTTAQDGTHTYAGTVKVTGYTQHGAVFYSRAGCVLNIYGGNFVGVALTSAAATGGGTGCVSGELNMYDGKISGGDSSATSHAGGNLNLVDGGTINFYGGTITGGNSKANGGNIYVGKGTLNIKGGLISGGTSAANGGNIRLQTGTVNMTGGTISGGNGKEGGNISTAGTGTLNVSGGVIEGGIATSCGGNIMDCGPLNISGSAIIRNGTAQGSSGGGNICCYANKSNIKITGGTITGGVASVGANLRIRTSSSVTVYLSITGGKIEGVGSGATGHSVSIPSSSRYDVTVGGTAVIDDLYLEGSSTNLKISTDTPLTASASIGISAASERTVASGVAALTGLKSADDEYELVLEGTDLKLVKKA